MYRHSWWVTLQPHCGRQLIVCIVNPNAQGDCASHGEGREKREKELSRPTVSDCWLCGSQESRALISTKITELILAVILGASRYENQFLSLSYTSVLVKFDSHELRRK